jgi:hypothetical protein
MGIAALALALLSVLLGVAAGPVFLLLDAAMPAVLETAR